MASHPWWNFGWARAWWCSRTLLNQCSRTWRRRYTRARCGRSFLPPRGIGSEHCTRHQRSLYATPRRRSGHGSKQGASKNIRPGKIHIPDSSHAYYTSHLNFSCDSMFATCKPTGQSRGKVVCFYFIIIGPWCFLWLQMQSSTPNKWKLLDFFLKEHNRRWIYTTICCCPTAPTYMVLTLLLWFSDPYLLANDWMISNNSGRFHPRAWFNCDIWF